VVHGVMRTHAGAVDVHSTPGQGSCFTLYFPAQAEGAAAPTATEPAPVVTAPLAPPGAAARHVRGRRPGLVFLVERLLRRRGYRTSGYTDPLAALQALRAAPRYSTCW
jgi:hypothetical protein